MKMINKKLCPFCGSNDLEFQILDCQDKEGYPATIVCMNCGCQGPWSYTFNNNNDINIWKEWNKRCDEDE